MGQNIACVATCLLGQNNHYRIKEDSTLFMYCRNDQEKKR